MYTLQSVFLFYNYDCKHEFWKKHPVSIIENSNKHIFNANEQNENMIEKKIGIGGFV